MDTKALRQKVLDLAIRGKLVPQDPNDEPASVLLERIRQQKQQMVKEGKLKAKDIKNDTVIFVGEDNLHYEKFADGSVKCIEDEIPFDLPDGWAWSKINSIAYVTKLAGFEYTKNIAPSLCEKGIPLFKGKNIQNSTIVYEFESFIPESVSDELQRSQITKKCILTPYVGTIGNIGIHNRPGKYHLGSNVGKIEIYNDDAVLLEEYVVSYLQSAYGYQQLTKHMKATAQASISIEAIRDVYLPVPPASEQWRMWHALSNALTLIEFIENTEIDIAELIKSTKAKILDLAIRGQLVPQYPNDEPASALLERIRAEKEELIKAGKIKRDHKESVIFKGEDNSYYLNDGQTVVDISDDLPFDIPDSWCWTRLKDVFIINPRNKLDDDLDVSFIPMPLIDDGYRGKHTAEMRQWKEVKTGFTHFAEGDVGVAKITPCFENRKSTVFENLSNGYGAGTTELHVLRPFGSNILAQYLLAYVKSDYFVENGKQTFTGAVGQQRIGKEYVENAYFPIPPANEQKRIVQQISTVFEYLNMISESLS